MIDIVCIDNCGKHGHVRDSLTYSNDQTEQGATLQWILMVNKEQNMDRK